MLKRILFTLVLGLASPAIANDLPLSLNIGQTPNDGLGDSLRNAFIKTQAAFNAFYGQKGVANGIATLNATGIVPLLQLPIAVSGVAIPLLSNQNIWSQAQIFQTSPTFSSLSGYVKANNANQATSSLTIPIADIAGLATSATTDTTNAANITSGTLELARLPTIPASQTSGVVNKAGDTMTGALGINSDYPTLVLDATSGYTNITQKVNGIPRWNTASDSNSYIIQSLNLSSAPLRNNIVIDNTTGNINIDSNYVAIKGSSFGVGTLNLNGFAGYGWATINGFPYSALSFSAADVEKTRLSHTSDAFRYNNTTNVPHVFSTNNVERARISDNGIILANSPPCISNDATVVSSGWVKGCVSGGSGGGGTVSSVNISGGATGLTVTDGPVTTAGTMTLGGVLSVANGGTGSPTPAGGRAALGIRELRGVRTPYDFGAVGDCIADDTAAITSALNSGYHIIAIGNFGIYGDVFTNLAYGQGVSMEGAGKLTKFCYKSSNASFRFATPTPNNYTTPTILLKNFEIEPQTQVTTGNYAAAISIVTSSGGPGSVDKYVDIQGVRVKPDSPVNYVPRGLYLSNTTNASIREFSHEGRRSGSYQNGQNHVGIDFFSDSAAVDFTISGSHITYAERGINLQGNWQGAKLRGNTLLAVRECVNAQSSDNSSDSLEISGTECAPQDNGFAIYNIRHANIHDNDTVLVPAGPSLTSYPACILSITQSAVTASGLIHHNQCNGQNRPIGSANTLSISCVYVDGFTSGNLNTIVGPNECVSANYGTQLGVNARGVTIYTGANALGLSPSTGDTIAVIPVQNNAVAGQNFIVNSVPY